MRGAISVLGVHVMWALEAQLHFVYFLVDFNQDRRLLLR